MDFYSTTFFTHGKGCAVHLISAEPGPFPVSIRLNSSGSDMFETPEVTIHFNTHEEFISFKNSVIQAHREYLKEMEVRCTTSTNDG